jgi:hypothetical protein
VGFLRFAARPTRARKRTKASGVAISDEGTFVFAIFTAIIGFLGTLVLTLILMTECLPRSFQRDSKSRLVLVGFCIFFIAWIGGYIGYRLGS